MTTFLADIVQPQNCPDGQGRGNCLTAIPEVTANQATADKIFSFAFGTIAAICVFVIVLAALNWAIRGGDSEVVMRSRKTIVWAVIGLAVSLLAEVLVLTLLDRI
jgi:uncharacterized membrane protein